MRSKKKNDFEVLVGRIQATSDALQQDALVVINRSVTTRAWLTGYYIVEYEQHGADRAKYGTGLLKKLAARLNNSNFALPSLKNYRAFYKVYPEVGIEVAAYLRERFGKGYTACSLLADAPTLALQDKSYDDSYERVDLVFYHRILKCHVLIELKAKKLNHADVSQLGVYMGYYRKHVMQPDDNPPVGILLCTEVGGETMEYVNAFIDPRLFVSKYQLQLPKRAEMTEFLKKENKANTTAQTQMKQRRRGRG